MNETPSVKELQERLSAVLARLTDDVSRGGPEMVEPATGVDAAALVRHLGMVKAGATPPHLATVRRDRIGFGSRVVLRDLDTDETVTHHIMSSQAMDIGQDHVSLESPLGDALLGGTVGDVVDIRTPGGLRSLEVLEVRTLVALLDTLALPEGEHNAGTSE